MLEVLKKFFTFFFQAFVVLAVFLLWRTRAIGPVPFAVKAMAESVHGMSRLKVREFIISRA